MSGTPVFTGTRVPIKTLFDYLEGGDALDSFLGDYPTVRKEQAIEAIALASKVMSDSKIIHALAA